MTPDFRATDDSSRIRAAFMQRRAVLVRSAIDSETVARLSERAAERYAHWDARIDSGAELTPLERGRFKNGHILPSEIGQDLADMAAAETVAGLFANLCGWTMPVNFEVRRMLPPVKRRKDVHRKIVLHQDAYLTMVSNPGMTKPPPLYFTAWMPLVPCGDDAPGLSVVLGSDEPVLQRKPLLGWRFYIRSTYGRGALWSPVMEPGDILLFTNRTIHGSHVTRHMTKPRYSIEMRGGISWPTSSP